MSARRVSRRKRLNARFRAVASTALIGLLFLQTVTLAVFAADPGGAPWRGGLLEAMWLQRRPGLAIALTALLTAGPLLSIILWRAGGWRRWITVALWTGFAFLLVSMGTDKMESVGRVLWSWKILPLID